ncbi:hypothetical protein ACIQ6U_02015 [Lysinibacillus fusiformis]|uniref:hypothetical protein n=1 Tax=Lysinibacillus fusiformis TaxID=28031 RepID=UPI0037F7E765
MSNKLSAEEIPILLSDYRLTFEPAKDATYSISAENLLDAEQALVYLQTIAPFFQSPSLLVTHRYLESAIVC